VNDDCSYGTVVVGADCEGSIVVGEIIAADYGCDSSSVDKDAFDSADHWNGVVVAGNAKCGDENIVALWDGCVVGLEFANVDVAAAVVVVVPEDYY
jgi:hypothetical protein